MIVLTKDKLIFIRNKVCEYYGITIDDISNKSRRRDIVLPRHIYHYLARKHTKASLSVIASYTNKDHAIVLNSINRVNEYIDTKELDVIDSIKILEGIIWDKMGLNHTELYGGHDKDKENNGIIDPSEMALGIIKSFKTDLQRLEDHIKTDKSMEGFRRRLSLEIIDKIRGRSNLILS